MLRFNVQRVCKFRGIDKPSAYFQSHGISLTTTTRALKGEYLNFSMDTIERFCLLLHCTPNDLLEWTHPETIRIPDNEPLNALCRLDKVISVSQLIHGASLEKLQQMEVIIRKEMGI